MKTRYSKVKYNSTWKEIFGNKEDEMPPSTRRERWKEWQKLAAKEEGVWDVLSLTETDPPEGCDGCNYADDDWCMLKGLPRSVNPIDTIQHNVLSMACKSHGNKAIISPSKKIKKQIKEI